MASFDKRLPYPVKVDSPGPTYARMSQQAIGGWTLGRSLDGKGAFNVFQNEPMGEAPVLGPGRPDSGAETRQIG